MGRTSKNIKLKIPEKPRKINGFRSGSYQIATTISSRSRYDHFDTSPCLCHAPITQLYYYSKYHAPCQQNCTALSAAAS